MVHFTCDLCGKPILTAEDLRYVVKIEVSAAKDPLEFTEEDLDEDHMAELSQIIKQQTNGLIPQDLHDQIPKNFRFDLCSDCQKKFLKDPLSRETSRHLNFSEN